MFQHKRSRIAGGALVWIWLLASLPAAWGNIHIEITSVNADNYPVIHLLARATDEQGNYIEDLGEVNFEVRENGTLINEAVEAQFGYMAVTLVMDESGSMIGWEQEVIQACNYFVNGLDNLDKGAIVKFATTAAVTVPMTYYKSLLLQAISTYDPDGMTDLWDAIDLGIQECYYEPEKKAVVAFTDGNDNQPGVSAAQLVQEAGTEITLYTIGIGQISPDSLIYISEQTGGFYLPIVNPSQMEQVLDDIRQDIGNLYDLYYTTPSPACNGSVRNLEVVCNYQGYSAWDTISYVAPLNPPPVIALSQTTQQLLGVMQPAGLALNVTCNIGSFYPIENARIYYKNVNAVYFTQANLLSGGGHTYYLNIPGSAVQSPGLEFYLQATNDHGATVTLPGFQPAVLAFSIPVSPNQAPSITCELPEEWLTRRSLPVEATVTDPNGSISSVKLYYRAPAVFTYEELPMTSQGGGGYQCVIEGPELNAASDLDIFIVAWDNQDVARFWHLADDPFHLEVVNELGPTPPAVNLTSQTPPIVIPAAGGQFFYTMEVINPIPSYAQCDVWADMVTPAGAVQELGLLEDDLVLFGGEVNTDAYIQEVPGTAAPGDYLFRVHSGDYTTQEIYYTDSFSFTKSATLAGPPYNNGWRYYPVGQAPQEGPGWAGGEPALRRAFPNPFNATTSLQFYLPEADHVTLIIYNVQGREVARLADGWLPAGTHETWWDAQAVSSGVYLCRLITRRGAVTTPLNLVK
ncbi:MAG: VWA domain-containing protein [Candidatus Zixiibacteriota bacterium]|nr:MAG: VWA domain-containing protein [candidate division Zixibacteria bacterium]